MSTEDPYPRPLVPSSGALDLSDAEYYLATLVGPDWATTPLVFQTFDDNRDRRAGKDPYARVLCGAWAATQPLLTALNRTGAGVFVTVNATEGGRKVEHLRAIRAVWCEWDQPQPLPDWPVAPHLVVETSPQKYHVYWLTQAMTPGDHFRVMATIAHKWGGDANAIDVVRVLRVPGFYHQKVDRKKGLCGTPFLVRVVAAEAREALPLYATETLLRAFGVRDWEAQHSHAEPSPPVGRGTRPNPLGKGAGPPAKGTSKTPKPEFKKAHGPAKATGRFVTPINLAEIKDALRHLSATERDRWLTVGMALASTNHSAAFALWDEWSKTNDPDHKYDEEDQYRTWRSFREQRGGAHRDPVTLGTLYKLAKDAGWQRAAGWQTGLITNQAGAPVACPANIALILRSTPAWKEGLRFDCFGGYVEYGESRRDRFGRAEGAHRWTDIDDGKLADYLRAEHRMGVSHLAHCTQAVELVAHEAAYDPIVSWLDSLPAWDGIDRVASFFADFCGVAQTPYAAFCGASLFLSLVARAYQPGCQVDTVLVLQGPEGAKKTSLCRLLGGPWYKAITLSVESKDLLTTLRHTWVGELAELDSFARSGRTKIMAFLTTLDDTYRPPYARNDITQPRRAVFIGTTNDPAYLVDPHGARRFLPMKVADINIDGVAAVLDQLFAEARARFQAGESWWDAPPAVTAIATELRELAREVDPWEAAIAQWAATHSEEIHMEDVLGSLCLNIPTERRTRACVTRIGTILHRLGYEKRRRRTKEDWSQLEYVYVRTRERTYLSTP